MPLSSFNRPSPRIRCGNTWGSPIPNAPVPPVLTANAIQTVCATATSVILRIVVFGGSDSHRDERGRNLMDPIRKVGVRGDAGAIAKNLTSWLEQRQIIVYRVVHHTEDMRARNIEPPVDAWTVIFGNPALGSAFLADSPASVVDIPLRIGLYQATAGETIVVMRTFEALLGDHNSDSLPQKARKADDLVELWLTSLDRVQ